MLYWPGRIHKERLLLPSTWKADGPWKLWRDSDSMGGGTSSCRGSCACEGVTERFNERREKARVDSLERMTLFVVGVRRGVAVALWSHGAREATGLDGRFFGKSTLRAHTPTGGKALKRCGELRMAALPDPSPCHCEALTRPCRW